jgi:S1-C subfamily serine protease
MRSMSSRTFSLVAVVALSNLCCLTIADADDADLSAVVKDIRGQVVQIVVPFPDDPNFTSKGSGFWLSEQGLVATCLHVVKDNPTGLIRVLSAIDANFDLPKHQIANGNWDAFQAKVIAVDSANDIAILQTDRSPMVSTGAIGQEDRRLTAHYAIATLNQNLPQAGSRVLLAGFPLGQPYLIVQQGTVAAIANDLPGWRRAVKILVSTVANHGNSGAPIIDEKGGVIGMLEGEDRDPMAQERTGISVAVPAYFISELAKTVQH